MSNCSRWLMPAIVFVATSANAGDEILYAPAPDWVAPAELPAKTEKPGAPLRVFDQQVRLEDGVVRFYQDTAVALDSPQALTAIGTLSAQWLPDKGDLTIHRAELIRDGRTIDLLGGAASFQILRRETGLEARLLDGILTATMPVSGAQVGDVLRMSYSITRTEQALGKRMQWIGVAIPEPAPIASARIVASWPEDSEVRHTMLSQGDQGSLKTVDGYRVLTVDMPIPKPPEMPEDAPSRYRIPALVQIGDFADWQSLSASMAPFFEPVATVDAPGLAEEIARIEKASADPVVRAALATQFVQDEISYLMNGLEGGNYIPQTPAETWVNRYGDCKAKSLLLLTMLTQLGIEARTMLVNSEFGDALPNFQPMAAAFDHMIVHARIDGRDYWLDGTSSGSRLANLHDAPRFYHGLPLTEAGSDLVEIPAGPAAEPLASVRLTVDQRAGIAVPALYDYEVVYRGTAAAAWKAIGGLKGTEQFDDAVDGAVQSVLGGVQIIDRSASFNDESGEATVRAHGLMTTPFRTENATTTFEGFKAAEQFGFDNNRARSAWRDIPVSVTSPYYRTSDVEVLLPSEASPFRMTGSDALDLSIGGNTLRTQAAIEGDRYRYFETVRSHVWEIPASDLPKARRDVLEMRRALPQLEAPNDARRMWDYRGKDRVALKPVEDAYAAMIADADDDDNMAYGNRARFRLMTGDFEGAVADFGRAIEIEASEELFAGRSEAQAGAGDLDAALADALSAQALGNDGSTHEWRITLLGLLGRGEEALEVADDYALIAEDIADAERVRAEALGWAGRADEGHDVLAVLVEEQPEDATLLNSLCWHGARWTEVDDSLIAICTRAVETAENPAAARDSRALALFRAGRNPEALADLDAVLATAPDQQESRYLRGIVRLAEGDSRGREDIAAVNHASPLIARTYAAYGIEP